MFKTKTHKKQRLVDFPLHLLLSILIHLLVIPYLKPQKIIKKRHFAKSVCFTLFFIR